MSEPDTGSGGDPRPRQAAGSRPDAGAHADGPQAGGARRLERAPGERYATRAPEQPRDAAGPTGSRGPSAPPGVVRALVAADLVALAGALAFFGLGLLDLGPGLLAASAAIGWAVALALVWAGGGTGLPGRATRMVVAGGLGAAAIVVGLLLVWAWGRGEGGVLDPVAYVDERFGPLGWLDIGVAAVVGALRAR